MPPKRTSQARAKPTTVSKQKKRRTSMNLEVGSPALSPDVLETITAQVTQRVTATIRDELTALITNINSNSASNNQGSISINPLVASNNDDNDRLVTESRHLDNAIQHSVEAVVVDHTEKLLVSVQQILLVQQYLLMQGYRIKLNQKFGQTSI